jgi:curved DNA-binding protein CbpA
MMTTDQQTDFYKTLGLESSATGKEIKQAYRAMVRTYHPDTARNVTQATNESCRHALEAYETLSDPQKKATYDKRLPRYVPPPVVPQAEDITVAGVAMHVVYRFDAFSGEILANVYVQLDDIRHLMTLPHIADARLEKVHALDGETEVFSTHIYPASVCDLTDKLATYRRNQQWQRLISRLHRR